MNEIYWITVLGNLSNLFMLMCILLGLTTICIAIILGVDIATDTDKDKIKLSRKLLKRSGIAFIVASIMAIFTPSTKDLYAIYGIGGVIDYVQSNETAKQLPDKTIKALDKWLDELNKEEKDGENN